MTIVYIEIFTRARAQIVHAELVTLYAPVEADPDIAITCEIDAGPYPSEDIVLRWLDESDTRVIEARDNDTDTLHGLALYLNNAVHRRWGLHTKTVECCKAGVVFLEAEGRTWTMDSTTLGYPAVYLRDYWVDHGEADGPWDPLTWEQQRHGGLNMNDLLNDFVVTVTTARRGYDWTAVLK